MTDRRTGRTTRMAQEALDAVRSGQSVAVITHSRRFEDHYLKPLFRHLAASADEIGRIRFFVADRDLAHRMRGYRFDRVLKDHSAWIASP